MSVNKVILVGHVGKDPEVKYFDNDVSVARFSLATSETFTRNGEKITQTEWHNIVVWRGLAKVAENYIKKGMQLYIEGMLRTRSWDDADGNKRYTTEIVASTMQMLGKKADNENTATPVENNVDTTKAKAPQETIDTVPEEDDDLPF